VAEEFFIKELPNGLMLLGQQMEHVASAAMTFVVPAGSAHDHSEAAGSAAVACEWVLRGAGDRNTRQLNEALDSLGCQHDENVQSEHLAFSAAQLGRNLADVLAIYADIILRPRLEDATFEPCRELTLQDLSSLEDEPARKCMLMLREKFYPYPLGRCVYGTAESLRALAAQTVRKHLAAHFSARGSILSIAGNIDWNAFCDLAETFFGPWPSRPQKPPKAVPNAPGVTHEKKESAQTHIALAYRTVPISDRRYYAARMAETVLSGGMSSRLFTEVREKRGLAYHVSTRYHSLKKHAGLFTYAGTRPDVAQQTFDVTLHELRRLVEGIEPDEMHRARTQLKSALVMQGESTPSRSSALASDWYHLRRLRSLQELSDAIDKVTVDEVLGYLREFPPEDFTVLVVGPENIDTHQAYGA